jgi:hypothetical protein
MKIEIGVGRRLVLAAALLGSSLSGCAGVQVAKYDEQSYQQVAFVKPEILAVYDTFTVDPINEAKVEAVDLKLAQYHSYEAGKGPANAEMTQQIGHVQELYKKHVAERRRDGPWNATNLANHKETITDACDIAIKTERVKNK